MKNIKVAVLFIFLTTSLLYSQEPKGLQVGDTAPDFTGIDQIQQEFNLYKLLEVKSVVLVFYRGEWCPHCNKHLSAIQDSLAFILEKGAVLVGIAPQLPENIDKTTKKADVEFPLIYDKNYVIMNDYDVAFTVDDATVKRYKKWNIHLDQANGDDYEYIAGACCIYCKTG